MKFYFINKIKLNSELTAWTIVFLWILGIYFFIPIARTIQTFIRGNFSSYFFFAITGFFLGILFVTLYKKCLKNSPQAFSRVLIFFFIISVFVFWAYLLRNNPERTIHFVQYGFLAVLLINALRFREDSLNIYIISVLIASIIGTLDEVIQWHTPDRYFDYDDIKKNSVSALLMSLLVAFSIRPNFIKNYFSLKSLKFIAILLTIQIMLFIYCLTLVPEVRLFQYL